MTAAFRSALPQRLVGARLALTCALVVCGPLVGTLFGQPAPQCWLDTIEQPTTGDGLAVTHPSVAPMREVVIRIDQMARGNPVLQRLSNARLRNTRFVGHALDAAPRYAEMSVVVYAPDAWADGCSLIRQADRIRAAELRVSVNGSVLQSPLLRDESLVAYREPQTTGRIGTLPVYSMPRDGEMVIVTAGDRLPWVPVTLAEYLDYLERDVRRRLATIDKAGTPAPDEVDEDEVRKMYETLRGTNPQAAEEFLKGIEAMRAAMKQARAEAQPRIAAGAAAAEEELRALRAHRESLSAAELAAQARWVGGPFRGPETGPASVPLVKVDPTFGREERDPTRVQMIVVFITSARREYLPEMAKALRAMDYGALRTLIR